MQVEVGRELDEGDVEDLGGEAGGVSVLSRGKKEEGSLPVADDADVEDLVGHGGEDLGMVGGGGVSSWEEE